MRHLSLEIMHEYSAQSLAATSPEATAEGTLSIILSLHFLESPATSATTEQLLALALDLVAFFMKHNAEVDACGIFPRDNIFRSVDGARVSLSFASVRRCNDLQACLSVHY